MGGDYSKVDVSFGVVSDVTATKLLGHGEIAMPTGRKLRWLRGLR